MQSQAQTPARKGVRWAFDVSNSPFGGAPEPSTPETSTSSLAYVNSQIIAHGFARAPLDLSELARDDQNKVVKCILGMLSQRVDDMGRAEDLSARLRTLSYEHERLSNMLRASKSQILQAERETEAARTKTNALTKELTAASSSHNRTSTQLTHTTSALTALRQASIADTRKREQELARLRERWQRLASEQAKLGTVGSGMVCANWAVDVNEQYVGLRSGGEEVGEGAMRDAVEARERMTAENDEFREVLGKLVNVIGEGLKANEVKGVKLPTAASLFNPPTIEEDTGPALNAYRALRDLIQQLAASNPSNSAEQDEEERALARSKAEAHREEIVQWEEKVEKLEREIARLSGELAASNDFAERGRILIEQMANDKKAMKKDAEEHISGEAATLAAQRQELEDERAKFTDAAIRLARERSEFEVERLQHAEEKRQWAAQQLGDEPTLTAYLPPEETDDDHEMDVEPILPPPVAPSLDTKPQRDAKNSAKAPKLPEPKTGEPSRGLAGALRVALKAAAEVEGDGKENLGEKGKERVTRSAEKPSRPADEKPSRHDKEKEKVKDKRPVPKPTSPIKAKAKASGKRTREEKDKRAGSGREKRKRVDSTTSAPTAPAVASGSGAGGSAPEEPEPAQPAVIPPTTPRSLHPAAQRARARNYAPAVPSPLSRILSMAASPEGRGVGVGGVLMDIDEEDVFGPGASGSGVVGGGKEVKKAGGKSPAKGTKSPAKGVKSPGRGIVKSPGRGIVKSPARTILKSPGRVIKSPARGSNGGGLASKFAAAAAKEKTKTKPKDAAGKSKDEEQVPTSSLAGKPTTEGVEADPKGKGKARAEVDEAEREKEEGKDLEAILAPRPQPVAPVAGSSRMTRAGAAAAGKPMRIPVATGLKRGLTPRKATVGGVRAKRPAAWKG
ncbi:hypothetical protein BDV93DRAFT_608660, partial [Ceratobasidium sp. AG-I]